MPQDNNTNIPENNLNAEPAFMDNPMPSANAAMPDINPTVGAVSDVVVMPGPEQVPNEQVNKAPVNTDVRVEIVTTIGDAKNVLIALSSDPSVDELSAAIGLSLYLDRIGKRATAIYSGSTPNTLEFLKPGELFEPSADTLQDFVIAINKDKADHLRYKLDGDFVKVYITPYKHKIVEGDLDFSYGDYNVDLVIALDVANGIDLDSALREHGRIMHDASIVNVTTGNPGKFGEIEWSDKKASSVSEMIAGLLYDYGGDNQINKDEATAFLTGVVAATNRFSNAKTTPETMRLSSRLMESGANQQLVSKNITPDTENEIFDDAKAMSKNDEEVSTKNAEDAEKLDIAHDNKKSEEASVDEPDSNAPKDSLSVEKQAETLENGEESRGTDEGAQEKAGVGNDGNAQENAETGDDGSDQENVETGNDGNVQEKIEDGNDGNVQENGETGNDDGLLNDLKEAQENLSHAGAEATLVDDTNKLTIENGQMTGDSTASNDDSSIGSQSEFVLPVPSDSSLANNTDKNSTDGSGVGSIGTEPSTASSTGAMDESIFGAGLTDNPAASNAPEAPTAPEINGVPEMNYAIPSDTEILPPPPAPPVDVLGANAGMPPSGNADSSVNTDSSVPVEPIQPAVPVTEPEPQPLGEQPAMQDQVYNSQASNPGAFKIPGM